MKTLCLNCFSVYEDKFGICPICGETEVEARESIDLTPGTVLADRYLVGRSVGSGGFGIIYKAWDKKQEKVVAIKEYFPVRLVTRAYGQKSLSLDGKSRNEFDYRKNRFLSEARTLIHLGSNKNLPSVYEYFEENNTAYYVMEFLEGMSLNDYMKQERTALDPDLALYITKEVGKALVSLHSEGIIHRDVTPDNIFICSDETMHIKLLDFGAARLTDEDSDIIDIIVRPGYSPVEQYIEKNGKRSSLDERTDLYSLAATLYAMLTGSRPQEAPNRKAKDALVSPRGKNADIPERVSNAVMKAMAVDKKYRFKSVEEFLSAIDGKKKVLSPEKEKTLRISARCACALAAAAVVGTGIFLTVRYFRNKRLRPDLDSCKIDIWYISDSGPAKEDAMEAIRKDFNKTYPDVKVKMLGYPKDEYDEKLKDAAKKGKLPNLFESSDASSDDLSDCQDLSDLLKSTQAGDCSLLQYYEDCYPDAKQMPLGVDYPIAFVIREGDESVGYDNAYFMNQSDFPQDSLVTFDSASERLLASNFDISKLSIDHGFYHSEGDGSYVLLTSTMNSKHVQQVISSRGYQISFSDSNMTCGQFVFEWSVGEGSEDEVEASKKLLSWMMGETYQKYLMVSNDATGALPICDQTFKSVIKERTELAPLLDIEPYERFIQYEPEETTREYSQDELLVYSCFESILLRDPSDSELQTWLPEMQKKQNGLAALKKSLLSSDEFSQKILANEQFVKKAYRAVLRRDADDKETEAALRFFAEGKTREEWLDTLFATDEWIQYSLSKGFSGTEE